MTRGQAWLLHLSSAVVFGSGVLYAWMLYLVEPEDPFALVNHPWQPMTRNVHLLAAPALVFAFGWIFGPHVLHLLRSGSARRRRSGLLLLALLAPLVFSGYLLQVATDETWIAVARWTHVATGIAYGAAYVSHQAAAFLGRKRRVRSGSARGETPAPPGIARRAGDGPPPGDAGARGAARRSSSRADAAAAPACASVLERPPRGRDRSRAARAFRR